MFDQPSENAPTPSPEPTPTPPVAPTPQAPAHPKRINPVFFVLLLVGMAALSSVATYAVMKFAAGSSQPTAQQPVTQTVAAPKVSQSDELVSVVTKVKTLLPSTQAFSASDGNYVPHRKVGDPYNFYAIGTLNDAWRVRSGTIAETSVSQAAKALYQYFVTDQKATVDTLIGEASLATLGTNDEKVNYYRINTADYTCSLSRSEVYATTLPNASLGAALSISCSTAEEFVKNAKVQQPFYAAMSSDKTYTPDITMLGMPVVKDSPTANYKTAEVSIGSDTLLAGGAMGLFYQTPDSVWHFFVGTQSELNCSQYNTTDLKKAYAGEKCYDETKSADSTVTVS